MFAFFRFITTISFFLCLVVTQLIVWSMQFAIGQEAGKPHCIAIIHPSTPVIEIAESSSSGQYFPALFKELRRLGYIEGQNLVVNRYSAEGHEDRHPALAREAVSRKCDVILGLASRVVARLKEATNTIPIVGTTPDPVAFGIVSNLARPGGNITGMSTDVGLEIWGKRLALFKEAVPHLSKVGFLAPDVFGIAHQEKQCLMLQGSWGFKSSARRLSTLLGESLSASLPSGHVRASMELF